MDTSRTNATGITAGDSAAAGFGAANVLHGDSGHMRQLRALVTRVARAEIGVLITGETGTGKELVARCLHNGSARHAGPFIAINCAAIPHSLLENELFGHEKGAFTGAVSSQAGRLEAARGGTLFLDEIGDMPLEMQAKLLRVLQERSFERVGSSRSIPLECRIVAATHQNLYAAMKEGRFRQDLFYRLNVLPIKLPPLRDRRDDIAKIVHHELERHAARNDAATRLDEGAMSRLMAHAWPGNVRELINLVERLVVLHNGQTVTGADIDEHLQAPSAAVTPVVETAAVAPAQVSPLSPPVAFTEDGIDLRQAVNDFEAALIRRAIEQCGGVMRRAARLLNIPRSTLAEKLSRLAAGGGGSTIPNRAQNEFIDEEIPDLGGSCGALDGFGRHPAPVGAKGIAALGHHRRWTPAVSSRRDRTLRA